MSVCNFDCLHCVYADCVNDELTLADYRMARERDRRRRRKPPRLRPSLQAERARRKSGMSDT